MLAYARARERGDFASFQKLGDWVLWAETMVPKSFENFGLADTVGRRSYAACYRILQGKWQLYRELADELPEIVVQVRARLVKAVTTVR